MNKKKSISVILCVLIAIPLFILSCEKQDEVSKQKSDNQEASFAELQSSIENYNTTFYKEHKEQIKLANLNTKRPRWGRFWAIVKADFMGAAIGATGFLAGALQGTVSTIVCAVSASVEAGRTYSAPANPDADKFVLSSSSATLVDSIGLYHNIIIQNILNTDISTLSTNQVTDKVVQQASLLGLDVSWYNSGARSNISETVQNVLSTIEQSNSNEEIIAAMIRQYPSKQQELSIAKSCLNVLDDLQDQSLITDYGRGITEIITNSVIPQPSKKLLKASVSVGVNSSDLWRSNN